MQKSEIPDTISWPQKTSELHNHHFDSTIWNDFKFRDDDIVISTYAKSGTTWCQQIVGQLLNNGAETVEVFQQSPWLDLRFPPKEIKLGMMEAQTHRRYIKTHLPLNNLVFSPKAKYIYIARDGRDVAWSLHNHHKIGSEIWYQALNETPGRVGPPVERFSGQNVVDYYRRWLNEDGAPFWSFWDNVRTWWEIRNLPNVLFVHF